MLLAMVYTLHYKRAFLHVVSQCSLMPGWWLASGDHRRLTGSGSALETCLWRCAIQMAAFTLLYFYFCPAFVLLPRSGDSCRGIVLVACVCLFVRLFARLRRKQLQLSSLNIYRLANHVFWFWAKIKIKCVELLILRSGSSEALAGGPLCPALQLVAAPSSAAFAVMFVRPSVTFVSCVKTNKHHLLFFTIG